jgi:alpha-N-arabinofuranosidase
MPEVAFLKASVVHSTEDGMVTLFLLNRSLDQELSVSVEGSGFSSLSPHSGTVLRNDDLEATNTRDKQAVAPEAFSGIEAVDNTCRLVLPPASWTVVRLTSA